MRQLLAVSSANGYERLLLDAMLGDGTLFAHRDGVEATWSLMTPILEAWAANPSKDFPKLCCGKLGSGGLRRTAWLATAANGAAIERN